ncbi:MAG: Kdo hydroxylase family protein [Caulobacteraceae bacterium]
MLFFPNLKLDIDHDFWAALPGDDYPRLKKMASTPAAGDFQKDPLLDQRLAGSGMPAPLQARLRREIHAIYAQVLPVYEALFAGYVFQRRQVVWRLNTIRNENLHIDTDHVSLSAHFARMFINLDNQPRIWMTGYTIDQMFERFGDRIPRPVLETGQAAEIRNAVNTAAFGGRSTMWWDREPRHVAYFDPGDVWTVDSRQIAHQIFYGRRAVSIDFFVAEQSMSKRKRHYLRIAEDYRRKALAPWRRPSIPRPLIPRESWDPGVLSLNLNCRDASEVGNRKKPGSPLSRG